MREHLPLLIRLAGIAQFGVLMASFCVPLVMDWNRLLRDLPKLMRQLFWVYGAYIVLTIIALAALSAALAPQLASGSPLSRAVCAYAATFWGLRLLLQLFYFDSTAYRTSRLLSVGYHSLTVVFTLLTSVYVLAVAS